MTRLLLQGGTVVTPELVIPDGWVLVQDDLILAVGLENRPAASDVDEVVQLSGGYLLPGLVDLHVHGGGGHNFDDGVAAIETGLAVHRRHGTTRSMVSLITNPITQLVAAIEAAAQVCDRDPRILGIHLEGPFLNHSRRGAHDPNSLLMPDLGVMDTFLAAGRGHVRVVTLAPELPGGPELIEHLNAAGVHVAVGHSDADYDTAMAAFAAGADLVTHAFNGMRPLHHRDPSIIGAAMDSGVVLEAINDGVHLHPGTVRLLESIGPGRIALITDAMGATCAGDGQYTLGAFDVQVTDGVARLVEGGSIAGSTLTMDIAVRRAVEQVGMPLLDAVNAASQVPATYLGLDDRYGGIVPGRVADMLVTDMAFAVRAVMVAGQWDESRRP